MSGNKKSKQNITSRFLRIIKNRNILVFFIFFLVAAFLWFLNAINKEYTTDIELGLSIRNLPSTMSLIEGSNNNLTISVSGHGYNLLREEIEKVKLPLVIDFSSKKNKVKLHNNSENCTQSYILTSDLKPLVSKRFGSNIKVVKISPDTIYFNLTQTYSRKIPIIPRIDYKTNVDYMLHGKIKIQPDSLTVYGPKAIIDTISSVNTVYKNLGTLGENHIKELDIDFVKNLRYSKTKILIDIPLEKYTETQIDQIIIPINVPENYNLKLIPDKVNIFYKVPLSIFEEITAEDFTATVDFETEQNQEIAITVSTNNNNIQITSISSISVNFLLEENEIPNE